MAEWIEHLSRIADRILLEPASSGEIWAIVAASAFIAVLVFAKVAVACSVSKAGRLRSMVCCTLGILALIGAMVVSSIYLEPKLDASMAKWTITAVGILVSLLVVVPLIAVFLRGSYVSAFITWSVTCLSIAISIYITSVVWDLFVGSGEKIKSGKQKKDRLQEIIDH